MKIRLLFSEPLSWGSLILLFVAIIFGLYWADILHWENFRKTVGDQVGAAILTAILAGAGFLFIKAFEGYQNARTSALALTSDIASIMRVIAEAGIAQHFILQFASPDKRFLWADVARKENYFTVFEAQVGNLGALREPEMVAGVTRFYTFLKASRDATSPLLGAIKGDGRPAKTLQTEEVAAKEPEAPDVKNHRVRMISVSVCSILSTTFEAGIEVIDTYRRIYDSRIREGINQDRKAAEETLSHIKKFTDLWCKFWSDNFDEYILKGHTVLDDELNRSEFIADLRMRYFDIEGLRESRLKKILNESADG